MVLYKPRSHILQRLSRLKKQLDKTSKTEIGYPPNLAFNYKNIAEFFKFHINNCGDPFDEFNYRINTKHIEREVIYYFAKLYHLCRSNAWGYVTSGGTEGNLYGLFLAREHYPNGILYYSSETHYSIQKIARLLCIKKCVIPTNKNGEINYKSFEKKIQENSDKPVIISLNYGTTVKGAVDNLDTIVKIIKKQNIKRYYIHCDAALFGMILPFIKDAPKIQITNLHNKINSIAVSGHKFIGSPIPCGIVLTYKSLMETMKTKIEYLNSHDTTILGSRSGHAALFLWLAIQTRGRNMFKKEALSCIKKAQYLYKKLKKRSIPCLLNAYSNIVVFKKPPKSIIKKWQLAVQNSWAHIVVMQHVKQTKINAFLHDLDKIYK